MDVHVDVELAEESGVDVASRRPSTLVSWAVRNSAQVGPDLRGDGSTPWRFRTAQAARGSDSDSHGGQLTVDAAVTPGRVLLGEAEHHCSGSLGDRRSTRAAAGIAPAPGDEVAVPAQKSCRLDEEGPVTAAGEQPCERGQHRSIRPFEYRPVDLASQDCHLVAQDDDLDREIRFSAANESDQPQDTAERPGRATTGSRARMLAAPRASRQSPAHSGWMTFSARTGSSSALSRGPRGRRYFHRQRHHRWHRR